MKFQAGYEATIWVGFRVRSTGRTYELKDCRRVVQAYVDEVGKCFSVEPCEFVYSSNRGESGSPEPGARIGLIRYPRFPQHTDTLNEQCLELARRLGEAFQQQRVTVTFGETATVMLEIGVDYSHNTGNT